MKIRVYQIDPERDKPNVKYLSLSNARNYAPGEIIPDPQAYDMVFSGEVECQDEEDVYYLFNHEIPEGHAGHSMSVSDVLEIRTDSGSKFLYCDNIGFKPVDFDAGKVAVRHG